MESKPKAGQMPGFQRSRKDQPKTNSNRSQFRCQQISHRAQGMLCSGMVVSDLLTLKGKKATKLIE
jgi:hypothetical protein